MIADDLRVFVEIDAERDAQDQQWGEQHHPDGTARRGDVVAMRDAQDRYRRHAAVGTVTWRDILDEEIAEAYAEHDRAKLRYELVQSAAVIVAWIEDLDSREPVT